MKAIKLICVLFILMSFNKIMAQTGSVGINNNGAAPDSKAILDISSNDKGLLVPRLTMVERATLGNSMSSTQKSMLVFDTDLNEYMFWDGTQWVAFGKSIKYNSTTGEVQYYDGANWQNINLGSSCFSLQQAYDSCGNGLGRKINVKEAKGIEFSGSFTNPDVILKVTQNGNGISTGFLNNSTTNPYSTLETHTKGLGAAIFASSTNPATTMSTIHAELISNYTNLSDYTNFTANGAIQGSVKSGNAVGVYGFVDAASTSTAGVFGYNNRQGVGSGVFGLGNKYGVNAMSIGTTGQPDGSGVFGLVGQTSTNGTQADPNGISVWATSNCLVGTQVGAGVNGGTIYYLSAQNWSDRRLKHEITDMGSSLDKIKLLKPSIYKFNVEKREDYNYDKLHFGLIAQDVEQIFPELVSKPKTENAYYSINYIELIPVLIKGMQEQQELIIDLQNRIKDLENK